MNSTYQWKGIGQVFGLLSITAALAACGSNGSTANTVSASGTPDTVATRNTPPAATFPPVSTPPATTTPASTPPATTTPASTPPATTTPASTPPATTTPASTPPVAASDTVTLSWAAPDLNTNGSALTNLAGYEIYYGTDLSAMTQQISINTVGIMDYVVSNLNPGTWYFEIVAINSAGVQSAPTGVVSTTI